MVGGPWKGTQCQYRRRSGLLAPHQHTEDVQTRGLCEVFIWASRVVALCAHCVAAECDPVSRSAGLNELHAWWQPMQMALFRVFQELLGIAAQHAVYHVPVCEHVKGAFVLCHVYQQAPAKWKKEACGFIELCKCQIWKHLRARSDTYVLPQTTSARWYVDYRLERSSNHVLWINLTVFLVFLLSEKTKMSLF